MGGRVSRGPQKRARGAQQREGGGVKVGREGWLELEYIDGLDVGEWGDVGFYRFGEVDYAAGEAATHRDSRRNREFDRGTSSSSPQGTLRALL